MTESVCSSRFAAAADAAAPVLVDELGDPLDLDGSSGHHLARVRRLRPGEHLTAADGRGQWCRFVVVEARRGRLRAAAAGPVMVEPVLEPTITLAFALTKGDGPERAVQQLTELGVDRLVPLVTARSIVRRDATRALAARERMIAVARAGAMQCRRSRLPQIDAAIDVGELRATLSPETTVVLATRDEAASSSASLPASGTAWAVVVGPEGGLERSDLAALGPVAPLAVGPHVLRSTTACVSAAAVLTRARNRAAKHGASQVGPSK